MTDIDALLDRLDDATEAEAFGLLDELRRLGDGLEELAAPQAARAARAFVNFGEPPELRLAADLAWKAHEAGVDGAGRTFAACADRLALMSGRPQKFGTVTYDHQGDAVAAPLDGSVNDAVRARFGLPDWSDMRQEVESFNRHRARERAEAGGLPDKLPFCRVWRDPSEAELRERWKAEGEPVWADGDELTFVCDRPLPSALVGPVFELPMWRVGDLLTLTVRVQRLEEAVLTYAFWPLDEAGRPAFTRRPEPEGRYRGPAARPAPPSHYELAGSLIPAAVESDALGQPRRVVVYRPPGHTRQERLPVVYATDGDMLAPFARRIDAGILAGTVPRVVVVAAHSAGYDAARGINLRGNEYLFGFDQRAFDAHQRFFVNELPAWAEEELGVSADPADRAVFGCSDGGAHALSVGLVHYERFRHVIAYSSGMPPQGREQWPDGQAPFIQLCAGILEPAFFGSTQAWDHWLSLLKIDHHWVERVCGHEQLQWVDELPDAVMRAFGNR